jgi:xanthine dehydrogenase accessory factor
MKDVIEFIRPLVTSRSPFVLATVLKTWGSSPRKTGAHMVISKNGNISGSVSGGCVEGDLTKRAREVLETQKPVLVHYGVTDEDAWTVGLSCGGKIDVYLQPFFTGEITDSDATFWADIFSLLDNNQPGVIYNRISEDVIDRALLTTDSTTGDWKTETVHEAISERRHISKEHEGEDFFFEVLAPKSKLIMFGASHIAADLVDFASQLNFQTIVIDPRGFFTQGTTFKTQPDLIYREWPAEIIPDIELNQFTYVVTLTHDPKIDDQALQLLLRSDVAYIGSLGSRRTHEKRKGRLREAGFSEEEIGRIHGPVGIDINAQTAQEIAMSIMSQIIQAKNKFV